MIDWFFSQYALLEPFQKLWIVAVTFAGFPAAMAVVLSACLSAWSSHSMRVTTQWYQRRMVEIETERLEMEKNDG